MNSSFSSVRQAGTTWWLYAPGGVGLFLPGLWVFNSPGSAFLELRPYFAVAIAFSGGASVLFALGNRARLPNWGWLLGLGLAEVLLGSYLVAVPVAAASVLAFIIGFWLLLRSNSIISKAFVLRHLGCAK